MKLRTKFGGAMAVMAAVAWSGPARAALIASDNASNAPYNDNSVNAGDNGGTGFGPWSVAFTGSAGQFVGNSNNNNGGSGSPGINTPVDRAWGMFTQGTTNTALMTRPFTGALNVGQKFSIDMDNGFIEAGETVGFALQTAGGSDRVAFFYRGFDPTDSYKVNQLGGEVNMSPNLGYTGNGLRIEVTLTGANTYSLTATRLSDSATRTQTGTLLNSGGIEQVVLFNTSAGNGPNHDLFFNNLSIVPEPVSGVLFGLAALALARFRRQR